MADLLALAEQLAQRFHETYERLAPSFGYETREASAKPWADVPDQNKRLMIAVCGEILASTQFAENANCSAWDEAARIADRFVGKAKRDRIARGWKMSRYQPHERDEIVAEENGGNIAATEIAAALRARHAQDHSHE
jgi:hypothetical protein